MELRRHLDCYAEFDGLEALAQEQRVDETSDVAEDGSTIERRRLHLAMRTCQRACGISRSRSLPATITKVVFTTLW